MSAASPTGVVMPPWARELVSQYESGAASQFILFGNVDDRMVLPLEPCCALGSLSDFLLRVLMARFDVVLSYDLGNGIRVDTGGEIFTTWPAFSDAHELPRSPRAAVETLTHYFRYTANLARLKGGGPQVGCVIRAAQLVAPSAPGAVDFDLSATALLLRDWSNETLLVGHNLATFLVTENLNDLHPLVVANPRTAQVKIPLPSPEDLSRAFTLLAPSCPVVVSGFNGDFTLPSEQLAGATLSAVEGLLKINQHRHEKLEHRDLARLKKELVERDCGGLIEFVESTRTLDDIHGQDHVKAWLRQDIALWESGDLEALPMGYLLSGPVGTGKTYLVECLAGEAGVPVVKLKNFRDRWIGSTEGNLERIFRLLHALGRCCVFVDEADQALGKRDSGASDGGMSGRIYSMIAAEMSDTQNRGKIIWILASSRPDLIEVDLKRPGRIDVKIPLLPTTTAAEGFDLISALCARRGIPIPANAFHDLEPIIPDLLTPGAAESLAIRVYRLAKIEHKTPAEALQTGLAAYQPPVPPETMAFQIQLAVSESSEIDFVPAALRGRPAAQ